MPTQIAAPGKIYRGNQFAWQCFFSRDVSDKEFLLQFKHSRFGDVIAEADVDMTHAGESEDFDVDDVTTWPYVLFTVANADTKTIEPNLLTGEVEIDGEARMVFDIPVWGQYAEEAA